MVVRLIVIEIPVGLRGCKDIHFRIYFLFIPIATGLAVFLAELKPQSYLPTEKLNLKLIAKSIRKGLLQSKFGSSKQTSKQTLLIHKKLVKL